MSTEKKKILIVTRNFPPLVGGMERLMKHLYKELIVDYDVHLVGPRGAQKYAQDSAIVAECPLYPTPLFLVSCYYHTFKMTHELKPHLIFSGSGVTGPAVYSSGHFFHVPVVCYLHGIDIIINNFIYKKIFLPSVRRADLVIVNSRNTASLATKTGIKNSAIHVLHPGITLPSHSFLGSDNSEFQCMAQTDNKKILLSVGRLTARKGLIPFIVHCLPKVVAWRDDVVFVIIGGEAHQALNKSVTTHNDILLAARKASMTEHVRVLGHVSDNILSQAYASSDLHVFPVLDLPGDIEGFGTVAVEAASYGLFTAAFASGGVTDAVAHNISGYLIEQGNYEKLSYVIVEHLKKTVTTSQRTKCIDFARQFTWKRCGAHLRQIFSNFLARSE